MTSNDIHSATALFANDAGGVDKCQRPEVWLALGQPETSVHVCFGYGGCDAVVYGEFIDHEADLWGQLHEREVLQRGRKV